MGAVTKNDYDKMVKKASPNSNLLKDSILSFISGGIICSIGEIILLWFKNMGFSTEYSSGATSIIMIFLGSFLTALTIYDKIAYYAKSGTLVPITGFANSVVAAAMEFKSEGYVMGLGAKMFTIAGPVLVFGTISSVICGIIYYFFYFI